MTKPFTEWTVLPHSPLRRVDDNMLTVTGNLHMPVGDFPRRMTVARLRNGKLVIYSAIALDETEMQTLETFGQPAYLIVPNAIHRMDAKIWKDRYPAIRVIAPPGVRAAVEQIVPVDATTIQFGDPDVSYVVVPGTASREAALLVHGASGTTLVINDLIWNVDHRPGFRGWVLKMMRFTGRAPKIPPMVKRKLVDDRDALQDQFEKWSRIGDLQRIIVSHGEIVTETPGRALHRMAGTLAA
ncbi:MAG: hypothetical protein JWP01_4008 [Myxococcales bacterium]|nr:hypothetical protein [Myxococcales bacterium]